MSTLPVEQVVISGYYGFGNVGDEAVLAAILQQLTHLWPKARYTVLSGNPPATMQEHGVEAISRHDLGSLGSALSSREAVLISGGGTLFQDMTSSRSLYYYLSVLVMGRRHRLPVIIYGQGLGPFRRPWNRYLAGKVLQKTQLVILRDQKAYDEALRWGLLDREKLLLGADPVLTLEPAKGLGPTLKEELGTFQDGPILLVSLRPWPTLARHLGALATALDILVREGWQVVFLPFQHDLDHPICQDCAKLMQEPVKVWDRPLTTQDMLSLTGEADYCLGMRLHSLIFAAIWGLPMVGLAYDPKVEGFLEELDLAEFVMEVSDSKGGPLSSTHLVRLMLRLAEEEEAITARIKAKTALLEERVAVANRKMEEALSLFWERR